MKRFENRTIVIVGAASAIGRSIAESVLGDGGTVLALSRNPEALSDLAGATAIAFDPTDATAAPPQMPPTIDGLVYAPGSITLTPFKRTTPEQFEKDFAVNVVGLVRSLHVAHDALMAGDGASVVAFSTVAVASGMPFHASVAASKGAVEGVMRSLAAEFAAKRVRFNVVAPSLTDTPLAARLLSNDAKRDASAKRHPLGRVGTPADIAAAACYLLSDEASWVTGQTIGVDGGLGTLRVT